MLGLSPGAVTMRFEARTFSHLSKERCICWLSLISRSFTIKLLQVLNVKACWNERKDQRTSVNFPFHLEKEFEVGEKLGLFQTL